MGVPLPAKPVCRTRQDRADLGRVDAIPLHPHNGPLQVWLELGAVGVLLVLGLLAAAWRATTRLERPLAAAAVAGTLVASSVPILVSFSLWNTWWLAALGFAAVFGRRRGLADFPHRYLDVVAAALHVDLAGAGEGA